MLLISAIVTGVAVGSMYGLIALGYHVTYGVGDDVGDVISERDQAHTCCRRQRRSTIAEISGMVSTPPSKANSGTREFDPRPAAWILQFIRGII